MIFHRASDRQQQLQKNGKLQFNTQRDLANLAGISLGQANYVLKSLLEKGLVKITNFTKSTKKISYVYRLTPKGIETKSDLAARFIMRKLQEYGDVKNKLAERLSIFEKQSRFRVFFVGPSVVSELIDSVIKDKEVNITLVGQCKAFKDLVDYDADFFDVVLLFEGNRKTLNESAKIAGIPAEKLASFW
jgi:EPS-associated MarR family transcriptional regulator